MSRGDSAGRDFCICLGAVWWLVQSPSDVPETGCPEDVSIWNITRG